MSLPVEPPVPPMLARLARELPVDGDGYLYEPKWDGFRALVFRDGDSVDIRSRHDRRLGRYFPELVEALLALRPTRFVLDGEIVIEGDFPALLARIHPAASRVERLSAESPAVFVAFDVLALADDDLRARPFVDRRRLLEELLRDAPSRLELTPATADAATAREWLEEHEGVIAKPALLLYEPGKRAMVKVKRERTADCVVAGFRWYEEQPLPSSLLLGLYDEEGALHHVGIVSALMQARRREVLEELRPLVVPLEGHPWEHGFLATGGSVGRLRGSAGRWLPGMTQDWTPVAPVRVLEVAYDQLDEGRFRHPAQWRRWRPDRDPRSCTLEQLR